MVYTEQTGVNLDQKFTQACRASGLPPNVPYINLKLSLTLSQQDKNECPCFIMAFNIRQ